MAKKNLRRLGRKALSMLLTLSMVTSMLQLTVLAADSYKDQTMDGYYTVDAQGNVGNTEATSVTEDGFTLSKTIQQTGKDAFDITLTVETSQTVETKASKAATVLVIDLSNSMKNNNISAGVSRMKKAREVAQNFLESYAGTDENASQYISVVWFGTTGGVDIDWVNVAGGEGKNDYNQVYRHLGNLSAPHSNDSHSKGAGGTNLERGLYEALKQMEEREGIVEQKNVVLLTDGKPTFRGTSSVSGDGQNGSEANNSAAKAQADAIKEAGASLYTVCIAAEDDVCYEGADIWVCEHCEETQDHHIKETVCQNCGESRSEHTRHSRYGYVWYTCADNNNRYYNEVTYHYCDESKTTQYEGEKISGDVTVGYFLSNDIASSASNAYNASTTEALEAALKAIASSIEASGMTGEGTSVTDPMGQYIVLGDVSALSSENVTASGSTITWQLDPEKASVSKNGDTTTYTYSVTYPITLDTAAKGFQEGVYYPTNGYTYLSVPQADGSAKEIAFLVPGVCGEIPEYGWTVEYYLQDEAAVGDLANYTLDDSVNMGSAELWSTVDAPEGYLNKYSSDNYEFEGGNVKLEITAGSNVMKLYYKHITSAVVVNHYYKTDLIQADGTEVPGTYPETPNKSYDYIRKIDTEFVAEPETSYDQAEYALVSSDPVSGVITVSLDAESNVINLYYSRLVDERVITSAQVNHVYTTYGYELQDGKYELVTLGVQNEVAEQAAEIRATTVFNVSDQPLEGYADFELNAELGDYPELAANNMRFTVADNAAENVRTLYFDKIDDNRISVDVTVNHYYTKTTTSVVDGQVVTTVEPDGELGNTSTVPVYVGEKFETSQINEYLGDTYVSAPDNAGKLVIEAVGAEGAVIDLYYTLSTAPEKTSLIVNHYWRTFTEVTVELTEEVEVEVTDPVTGEVSTVTETVVIGTTTEERMTEDHSVEEIEVDGLYVGESYTAPKLEWGQGYTFNAEESNPTGIAGTDYVLDLYYDKYADADEREDAEIDVLHKYTTHLETIVDGKVETVTVSDGTVNEEYTEYLAGDEFTATAQPVYNDNEYVQITEESVLGPVVLQPGTNATIVIEYERQASELVDTEYKVNYEYRTYTMVIGEDGVAVYGEPAVETIPGTAIPGYVGEQVVLESGSREGFAPLATNPGTAQTLAAEGNEWTFVHEQYVPLEKGSVIVNHYYSLQTIAIDGTSTWSSSAVLGTAVEKYLGEAYTAQPVPNGYDKMDSILDGAPFAAPYELNVSGDHVVDFHYKKVVDNSVKAPYTITHKYYLYDWEGSLISSPAEDLAPSITGTGYVTTAVSASPEFNGYTLTDATYNGSDLGELTGSAYSITLQDGSNDVVFVYEKTLARDLVDVTVIHNYYNDEASVGGEPQSRYAETVSDRPEDSEYTASLRNEDGYTFHSATPEDLTIFVTENGENVVVINYVRAKADYQIIHIYNRNGIEEGRTSETLGGLDGDVILADSIARVNTYEGSTYAFVSATGDITLDADAETLPTITLVYNRVVVTPPPSGPDYYTLTVEWVDEDGNELDDTLRQSKRENSAYETEQKSFEGYTFVEVIGDVPSGRMNGDKKVTYVYAAEVEEPVEIPEEEVPLSELPDDGGDELEELPDEEVPLANVPATGDPVAIYAAISALSGMGLAALNLTGKKRREDEE